MFSLFGILIYTILECQVYNYYGYSSDIFQGLSTSIIAPAIDDLRIQTGSDYEEITYILVARSVGVIVGAVSFGLINDKYKASTHQTDNSVNTRYSTTKCRNINSLFLIMFAFAHWYK